MRTLVFGARGQLGKDLLTVFRRAGEVHDFDLPEIDIADEPALQPIVEEAGPDLIINAAAYTDVDGAEDNFEAAFLANESGARNLAELAEAHQIPIVYFSTDYVFDGTKTSPYVPDDPVAPISVYGKSKAAGEVATRRACPRHVILRTAWLYGPGGNNFPEKMIQLARERGKLKLVEDEIGSPTHTLDLAEAALAAVGAQAFGTYHAVNTGACSRLEFAQAAFEMGGIEVEVTPCRAEEFPAKAARPRYSVLDTSALTEATGHTMRPWREGLADYMQRRESQP